MYEPDNAPNAESKRPTGDRPSTHGVQSATTMARVTTTTSTIAWPSSRRRPRRDRALRRTTSHADDDAGVFIVVECSGRQLLGLSRRRDH